MWSLLKTKSIKLLWVNTFFRISIKPSSDFVHFKHFEAQKNKKSCVAAAAYQLCIGLALACGTSQNIIFQLAGLDEANVYIRSPCLLF